MKRTVISGTGCYIPTLIQSNDHFLQHEFYTEDNQLLGKTQEIIIEKFKEITGINERRYAADNLNTSDIGFAAAEAAVKDSGIDRETIDQLIVAHNFGNVIRNTIQSDAVPCLASRIKNALHIKNPHCVAYDVLFGCPGWLQGVIQADAFFKAGIAKKALVIGTETLSRVIDKSDRDSMIFSDGAGAAVLEFKEVSENGPGILGTAVLTHAMDEVDFITMGKSFEPESDEGIRYIKMKGRKVYEYAMKIVPAAMKECMDNCGVDIKDVKKVFIHQANEKMDEGIIKRLFQLYNYPIPENIMPMSIHWLGNSSVATVPTLFDLVRKNKIQDQSVQEGDIVLFASVGAGMNVNAVCYRC